MVLDSCDDVFKEDSRRQSSTVVDEWVTIRTIPTVNCVQELPGYLETQVYFVINHTFLWE